MIKLKTKEDIDKLRIGGKKLASILQQVAKEVKVGVSTDHLNTVAHNLMKEEGGIPSFLNYTPLGAHRPYPAALCVSINDEIVHGIPNENPQVIKDGDLVTIDAGLIYDGLYTDHAITIIVGDVDKRTRELVERTKEALHAGIKAIKPGGHVGDIGNAISKVAESAGLSIMESLTGHGVGYGVHEDPYVPNYGAAGKGEKLEPGLVLAIEPMLSLGTSEISTHVDGYTYLTADGALSAQFEHTVVVTEEGVEVLTKI